MDSGKAVRNRVMKLFSTHIAFEKLADLAEGRASNKDREAAMLHLSACADCAGKLSRLENVMSLMRTDRSEDAPRDILTYAVNLFRPLEPSFIRRVVATLSFDSLTVAPAFGMRSGQSQSRQLVYSAEGNDIDLRITLQNNQWTVVGQVLRPDCVGGQVELEGAGGTTAAALNDMCEFTLPSVPSGNYLLRVKMADLEVEVPQLDL